MDKGDCKVKSFVDGLSNSINLTTLEKFFGKKLNQKKF